MSVILPPVPHQTAGPVQRHGPLMPAPVHAATMAAPVATTQMKQAVRPVDGLAEADRPDFVPAQRDRDRPEPHEWLGPKPSFRLHLLDALPDSMDPDELAKAKPAEPVAERDKATAQGGQRPAFAEFDAPTLPEDGRLDLRL
jgi:hypothetical protein